MTEMNLIERLGGYEYLNEFYKRAVAHGFSMTKIKKELLEYRRQHNIFEEGDKIVFIDDFMHGELMTVAWTRKGKVWMDEAQNAAPTFL